MIGTPSAHRAQAIVDPRGLVTPWFDGWSLDVWLEVEDGELCAPSRLADAEIEQRLHENLPIVVTAFRASDLRVRREAFALEPDTGAFVVEQVTLTNPSPSPQRATLYFSVRPFNPEGVAVVKDIRFVPAPKTRRHGDTGAAAFFVNHALAVLLPRPAAIACNPFAGGDVALALPKLNGKMHTHCAAGLATAVAAYRVELDPGQSTTLTARMPLEREELDEDDQPPIFNLQPPGSLDQARAQAISTWRAHLARGMQVRLPDEKLQAAFDANKAFLLLLLDGDTINAGPFTYRQFWFRDAAYLLNALDKLGYHAAARQVVERFPRRLQKDGYVRATEGEWDSNGAAIWAMVEHARLSGDTELLARDYWSLLKMASWINSKRRTTRDGHRQSAVGGGAAAQENVNATTRPRRSPRHGLLPPGPSAEHLGPSDHYYWDDFWGLAGLREAARAAEWLGQKDDAEKLRANFESFRADVDASLANAAARIGRAAMPAAPYLRLDAGMIGSLAALYPLRLFDARDPRVVDTLAALQEIAWVEDAYFNHVGHSAFGTYLSLHVAHCLLFQRDARAWKTINWVLRHSSPTFTWAEGIHPLTRRGGMGDGHHGWALADFLLIVRNALLFEEEDRLVLTPALPEHWCAEMNVIKVEDAPTYFGGVNFTIAFGERDATLAVNGAWRAAPAFIEWNLPFALRAAGGDVDNIEIVGKAVRLPRGATRVVATW